MNRSAVASIVLSLTPLLGVGSIVGLVLGYRARRQIAAAGGREAGRDMAEVGIALGWAGVILAAVLIPLGVMLLLALRSSHGG